MHNLKELVLNKIKGITREDAAFFFDVHANTIDGWKEGSKIPCDAAQRVLDEIKEVAALPPKELPWKENSNMIIGMPIHREVEPYTMACLFHLLWRHGRKIGIDLEVQSDVVRARNRLATRFMKSPAEWLFMVDDDMVLPVGNDQLYYRMMGKGLEDISGAFAGFDIITRLLSHEKTLIGGLYYGKSVNDVAQYAEAFHDEGENDMALTAPFDSVMPTKWVATGALLIHRTVFEAIEYNYPDVVTENDKIENGYFSPIRPGVGEDVSFCTRALKSGQQPYVDMGCVCGHIGKKTFSGNVGLREYRAVKETLARKQQA
jgi:hypothetical protein